MSLRQTVVCFVFLSSDVLQVVRNGVVVTLCTMIDLDQFVPFLLQLPDLLPQLVTFLLHDLRISVSAYL